MEHPFLIRLPKDLSKNQRRRVRVEVIEHIRGLDVGGAISEKKVEMIAEAMAGSPHPHYLITPSLDKDGVLTMVVESRAAVEERKKEENRQKMHKIQRRMAMKRTKNRPESWSTFFRLSGTWPDKLQNIMPLDDPDDVASKKNMYEGTLTALRSMNMETKSPYFRIWSQYIESCF